MQKGTGLPLGLIVERVARHRIRSCMACILLSLPFAAGVASPAAAGAHHSDRRYPVAHVAGASGYYCYEYVSPYSSCADARSAYVTSDSYNQASYAGGGYISVCDRIDASGYGLLQRYCNPTNCYCNEADSGTVTSDIYTTQYFYVGNNSPNTHTIDGYYAVNF